MRATSSMDGSQRMHRGSDLLAASSTAVLLGSAMFLGATAWVAHCSASSKIQLNLPRFDWVSDIALKTNSPDIVASLSDEPSGDQKFAQFSAVTPEIEKIKIASAHTRAKIARHFHRPTSFAKLAQSVKQAPQPSQTVKSIIISQASPEKISENVPAQELLALQSLHTLLCYQFDLAALGVDTPASMLVKVDTQQKIQPAAVLALENEATHVKKSHPRARRMPQIHRNFVIPTAAIEAAPKAQHQPAPIKVRVETLKKAPLNQVLSVSALNLLSFQPKLQPAAPDLSKLSTQLAALSPDGAGKRDQLKISSAAPEQLEQAGLSHPQATEVIQSSQTASSETMRVNSRILNTQFNPLSKHSSRNQFEYSPFGYSNQGAVEAFEWTAAVTNAQYKRITLEGDVDLSTRSGWELVSAQDHWSTLIWRSPNTPEFFAPLISNNTSKFIARLTGTGLQATAGIVFGKLPPGWSVEISGRSDRPVILDGQNRVSAVDVEAVGESAGTERYFIFGNVAPGAQLIYLINGNDTAAVGSPVIGGAATYLDLSKISKHSFSGRVLDAASARASGVSQIRVHAVGQNESALTQPEGQFVLKDTWTVGSYPLFIETDATQGYTHRYRVNPAESRPLQLFHMSSEQIQSWVSQLEGGVSTDSGIVIGAVPSMTVAAGNAGLTPSTRTLVNNPSLLPETYTVLPQGDLNESAPLKGNVSRFISVQVPEGPALSEVEDFNHKVVWSELLFASPGVVNVIGPY